jgi:adenosylcobinamide kinase/adenosylcobinamide-phosphate guanylyltransferase
MTRAARATGRLALVGGGARSGKSAFATRLALGCGERRVFVATAVPFDGEMRERIARHVEERGTAFATVEAPLDLEAAVARIEGADVVLIDCLTLWLSNLLLDGAAPDAVEARVDALARALAAAPFDSVLVTNEVGMGLVPDTPLGRVFRDVAGRAHQRLARSASSIYLAALGVVLRLRPGPVALVGEGAPSVR